MKHDLLVIGGGPGGYVAAIRAAQLGLNVGCIDANTQLGGTCLRVGCIPSKALLESSELFYAAQHDYAEHGIQVAGVKVDLAAMLQRKDKIVSMLTRSIETLFKKNNITRYQALGRIAGPGKVSLKGVEGSPADLPPSVEGERLLIATGSKVAPLKGVELDGDRIATSTEALAYPKVPESLVVIGAGYIGLELGSVWSRLGSKVTVVEYLDRILPGMDTELAAEAQKIFTKQGITFRLGARVTGAKRDKDACVVQCDGQEPIRCDRVLLAVGRIPNTDNLGLETVGIQLDPKGRIPVDDHFQTPAPNVFAIGDVIRGPMLAHKASEEGVACVERIVTGYGHVNYDAVPGVCYTHPEIATVGKTEDELKSAGIEFRKGVYQFRGNGRARALGQIDGRVKILADAQTDRILGIHILGPRAGDLIAEAVTAIEFGASSEDLARCCHAHPTLAEVIKEAALSVEGQPIHG